LKEFHTVFHHYYKNIYPVDFPFDNCCKEFEFGIQHSVSISFVCKDVGDNHTVDTFVLCSNVSSNFDYDIEDDYVEEGEDVSSSSESSSKSVLQHEVARPSMQDTKVFGSPIYDDYYNSEYDGNFYEQQISSFLSKAFDQQLYHNKNLDSLLDSHGSSGGKIFTSTHNENFSSKPLYDSYASEVEEGNDGDLKKFYEQITKPIPSLAVTDYFLEVNKPISDINGSSSSEDIKQMGIEIIEEFSSISHEQKTGITYRADIKQESSSSEIRLQSCSDLQIVEGGTHYQKEDMPRPFDLQLKNHEKVFLYGFHDPFADYLESLNIQMSNCSSVILLNCISVFHGFLLSLSPD
jgi:hypothetical protein